MARARGCVGEQDCPGAEWLGRWEELTPELAESYSFFSSSSLKTQIGARLASLTLLHLPAGS